ncbi:PfkB family carbohydrate kinase [Sorangium sp. So ce388]|uniref:PfkB family carbohydrate kinase n=1 Tax=Sorangium sp. So ce388 TaxID=3133309 RepID=UPI003F5C71B0
MAESSAELIVVGRLWVEYVAHGPWLPKVGETVVATAFEDVLGGRGARQAVAAARLGSPAALVAAIGQDERADSLLRRLDGEGVATRWLRRDKAVSSGAALVHLDPSRMRQAMIFPDPFRAISPLDVEAAADVIASARAVLVSLEVAREAAQRAIGLARIAHAHVVLDAAGAMEALSGDELQAVEILHATAREAKALVGVEVRSPATASAAAEALRARGPGAVLIDAGPDGHLLVTERGSRMFPRLAAPNADAEASDEVFVAALAAARAEGRSPEDATTLATAAQSLVGPEHDVRAFPRRGAVLRLLEVTTGRSWELDDGA